MGAFAQGAVIDQVTVTTTSGGVTTLTAASLTVQRFVGTTNQTIVLPNATTMKVGRHFTISNRSTAVLLVQTAAASNAYLTSLNPNDVNVIELTDNSTTAGTWDVSVAGLAAPLFLYGNPVPDSKLYILSTSVIRDGEPFSAPPVNNSLAGIPTSSINFQTQATTGGPFLITWPTGTVGNFYRAGFTLNANGQIAVNFSADPGSVTYPGTLPSVPSLLALGLPMGFVDLQCTGTGPSAFKSADPSSLLSSNVIVSTVNGNPTITNFSGGSGSDTSILTVTSGQAIAANALCYMSAGAADGGRTSGQVYPVDVANLASPDTRMLAIGWALNPTSGAGQPVDLLTVGVVNFPGGGLLNGEMYYASVSSPGTIQIGPPGGFGQWAIPVGVPLSSTQLAINNAMLSMAWKVGVGTRVMAATLGGIAQRDTEATYFVASESDLALALTAAASSGGVIVVVNSFILNSPHTIPTGVILTGRGPTNQVITFAAGSLTLNIDAEMRDLALQNPSNTGVMLELSGGRATLERLYFSVNNSNATTCIQVDSSSNRIFRCVFEGVVGGSAVGINYNSGTGNLDSDCVFS